jgi:AcrR family transcriptional regulator
MDDRASRDPRAMFGRPSSEQRLDAVLRLATEMFNRRGIGGTTLDDLASGLGIRKASLYNYVDSKNDLICQCLIRTASVRSAVMDVAEAARGKTIDRLAIYLSEFIRVLWDAPGQFPLMAFYEYPPGYLDSPEGRRSEPLVQRELERMTAMFKRGQRDGSLRKGDVSVLIHAFESPFVSLTRWYYRPEVRMAGREIQTTLNEFIIEGLRNRG